MRKPLFRGTMRWGMIISGVILSSLFLAACGGGVQPPSMLNPAGPVANQEAGLFWFILIVATVTFVVVEGALIFSVIRYRAKPNTPAPAQVHGNNKFEIAWTITPTIILFIVLGVTIRTMVNLSQPTGPKIEVKATGHQWWWEFNYLNQNFKTADELVVPQGSTIQVDLYSDNVIHSFWIPELAGKTDVIPGHDNKMWFQANQQGSYAGECAEFCGAQHANMNFKVIVLSSDNYQTWVSGQQQAAQAASGDLATKGEQVFKNQCVGCHGIVGVNLNSFNDPKGNALIGPNLTHFGSRTLIAGGVLTNTTDHLRQWLTDPQKVKPGNDMNVNLTQDQIDALIAYLQSLK